VATSRYKTVALRVRRPKVRNHRACASFRSFSHGRARTHDFCATRHARRFQCGYFLATNGSDSTYLDPVRPRILVAPRCAYEYATIKRDLFISMTPEIDPSTAQSRRGKNRARLWSKCSNSAESGNAATAARNFTLLLRVARESKMRPAKVCDTR